MVLLLHLAFAAFVVQPCFGAGSSVHNELLQLQRCSATGRLLNLANGSGGFPTCVDACVAPAVRTVQGGGNGFCLRPILRSDALDVAFTLVLRNVTWANVPRANEIRLRLPMAVGQALQVAPGDVMGHMMVRDGDAYTSYELESFVLNRKGESEPQPSSESAFSLDQLKRVSTMPQTKTVAQATNRTARNGTAMGAKKPSAGSAESQIRVLALLPLQRLSGSALRVMAHWCFWQSLWNDK